uniref:SAP domain-containing protein n=1 Tax=Calcidiscus leptoporus TaxID=127549 RepID=A0A7S0NQX4_9EUKA
MDMRLTLCACVLVRTAAYTLVSPARAPVVGRAALHVEMAATMEMPLAEWLETRAGVNTKFMEKVLATCDEEMIGSVGNLHTMQQSGLLTAVFKPVIAASIEEALLTGAELQAVPVLTASGADAQTVPVVTSGGGSGVTETPLSLREVKRRLMAEGQSTWGSEAELRTRLKMFATQDMLNVGASWDSASSAWVIPSLPQPPMSPI